MAVEVICSLQDDARYFDNLAFLRQGLDDENIHFKDGVEVHEPEFPFDSGRTYGFIRSASAKIGEDMTEHLIDILPGTDDNSQDLRAAFGKLFDYYSYKGYLRLEGQTRHESMKMFVFKPQDYVAHINFSCTTMKGAGNLYTVHTSLTCQKYTWFESQDTDLEEIMAAIQNRLNVDG